MKNIFAATVVATLFASAATAQSLTFGVDTEYTNVDGAGTTDVTVSVAGSIVTGVGAVIGGVDYDVDADVRGEFYVGVDTGGVVLTYGDQGDVFGFGGGLNTVTGTVLSSPTQAERNLNIDGIYGVSATVGLNTGTDVQNVQLVGAIEGIAVGVDYNLDTTDYVLGASYSVDVQGATVGGIVTYAETTDAFAAELNAGIDAFSGFVTADADGLDVMGVGYNRDVAENASLYVEGARNLNTDVNTIATGISFSF